MWDSRVGNGEKTVSNSRDRPMNVEEKVINNISLVKTSTGKRWQINVCVSIKFLHIRFFSEKETIFNN
jgi:hypothetical protein